MSDRAPVKRHHWIVRLTHWLTAILLAGMIASGLQIYGAFPHFGPRGEPYRVPNPWAGESFPDRPLLPSQQTPCPQHLRHIARERRTPPLARHKRHDRRASTTPHGLPRNPLVWNPRRVRRLFHFISAVSFGSHAYPNRSTTRRIAAAFRS